MRCHFAASLLFATGIMCLASAPVMAWQAPPQAARPNSPLDSFEYDALRSGPLLFVLGGPGSGRPLGKVITIDQWAEAFGRQVIKVGGLTVLAPRTMRVIEERPGVPDPYAKLKPEERLKVLLSLFTEDQWKQAGSDAGIGAGDLNDNQRPLFVGLLPEEISVQRSKLVPGDQPHSVRYEAEGGPEQEDPAAAHLRLNLKVSFSFSRVGSEDYNFMSGDDIDKTGEITTLVQGREARGDAHADPDTVTAFGVPIVYTVPNRLKRSQLDFAAPQLRALIPLDGDLKTLGDLLSRVAKTTGLDLTADRRIAALPLLWRIESGQKARATDILAALCWSVTGAFRLVGDSTYLLTDDIQGIGTRFAKLAEWAEPPSAARQKALDELNGKTSRNHPLSHIGFAPGDTDALPPSVLQRVNDCYINGAELPEFAPTSLPTPLQQQIEKQVQFWADNDAAIRTDRIQVYTKMIAQFVFPNGTAVEAAFSENIGPQYLQFAAKRAKPAPPAKPSPVLAPKPMPASLHRRVLVAQLPADDKSVADLLALAKRKGFTEVWLHVMLDDGEANTRLRSALKTARTIGISAGCAVSLLHQGGLRTPQDVNILGETGENYSKRRLALDPDFDYYYYQYAGWTLLDPAPIERILKPIACVQGLSALALKATAAPGWAADTPGGDGVYTNGYLGYTADTRLVCIREQGFDPIDVSPYLYALNLDPTLQFFPTGSADSGMWKALCDFRFHENTRRLGQVHAAIKRVAPSLPLYLDDRAIIYTQSHLCWYGRWDNASRMPINHIFNVESEERADAYASTDEPIRIKYGRTGKPEALAVSFGNTAQDAAKHWRGAALDLVRLTPAEALHMLSGFPNAP